MSVNKLPYQLLPHCRRLLRALLWHTRKLKLFKLIWQLTQIQLIGNITLQRADLKTFCGVTKITKSIRVPVFYFSFPLSVASIRCCAAQQHRDVGLETRCQDVCWLSLGCKSLAVALLEPGGQAAAWGGCWDTLCTSVPAVSPRPLLAGAVLQLS